LYKCASRRIFYVETVQTLYCLDEAGQITFRHGRESYEKSCR